MNSFKIATLSLVLPISAFAQGSAGNQYEVLADGGGGFGLLLANIVSSTKDKVLEYTPHEDQEANTKNKWNQDIIRENEDVF